MLGPEPGARPQTEPIQPRGYTHYRPCLTWHVLDRLGQNPTCIRYPASHHGVHMLAFETHMPEPDDLLVGMIPHRYAVPGEGFLYSEASLENVRAVTPCRGLVRGRQAVIGILLRYENGDRECLGQFRFDSMMGEVDVHDREWCIGRKGKTIVAVDVWPPRGTGIA